MKKRYTTTVDTSDAFTKSMKMFVFILKGISILAVFTGYALLVIYSYKKVPTLSLLIGVLPLVRIWVSNAGIGTEYIASRKAVLLRRAGIHTK
ncbi:MAG: hypothetical protein MUD00_02350 [Candidatus Pacebacteria bacterium]|jgi:hypothetical protein|nr:hypothetical protein [Candidatus Paceibacterota bacterium]